MIACTECPSVLCTRGSWEIFQISSQSSVYSCKKVFWGNSPKYFRRIPGRMGSHRPIISASAHTSRVILHHTVFNWTLRHGSILFTIYQSVLHSRYCLYFLSTIWTHVTLIIRPVFDTRGAFLAMVVVAFVEPPTGNKGSQRANFSVSAHISISTPGTR